MGTATNSTRIGNPAHHLPGKFYDCFDRLSRDVSSVIEFGCGTGDNLRRVSSATHRVGVDIEPTYPRHDGSVVFVIGEALRTAKTMDAQSFDLVLLIDIVEHLTKEDGRRLLLECKRIAERRVIVWIPEGDAPQSEEYYHDSVYRYTKGMDHISQWDRSDLTELGYDVAVWENYHLNWKTHEKNVNAMFAVWER